MTYSAEYQRAYYERNKEKILARNKAWALANPEKVKEHSRRKKVDRVRANISTAKWEAANPESVLLRAARNRAKRDGLEFSLKASDVVIPATCPLLGIPITCGRGGHGPKDGSPSLDRIDNSKGYVSGNVWVISWLANKMKATATRDQLLTFARNVQERFG